MKTKDELNTMKEEVETLNKKLSELSEEELAQVSGGGEVDNATFCVNTDRVLCSTEQRLVHIFW